MIIAFTSGFVHRFVYKHSYSPDGSLSGFTNNSLSYFNVSDFEPDKVYRDPDNLYTNLTTCRCVAIIMKVRPIIVLSILFTVILPY